MGCKQFAAHFFRHSPVKPANLLVGELRFQELAVQAGDVRDADTLRALELAGTRVGAVAEAEFVHLGDHRLGAALGLRTALRKQGEGADAGRDEEHRRAVLTRGHAGAAAHAGRCIHAFLRTVVRNQDVVGILTSPRSWSR